MGGTPDFEARAAEIRTRMDEMQRERARQFRLLVRILIGAAVLGFALVVGLVVWLVA